LDWCPKKIGAGLLAASLTFHVAARVPYYLAESYLAESYFAESCFAESYLAES
jgi:hypothetical protein